VSEAALDEAEEVSAVAEYKRIFKEVLDSRPSGMRIRLAHAMGKNRSFVSQITLEPRGRKLVAIIISIARAFRLPVVAEGVETQDQLDALWQLGCDQSQGYLHSRPVPGEEFADLLRNGKGRYILPRETEQVELRRDIRPS